METTPNRPDDPPVRPARVVSPLSVPRIASRATCALAAAFLLMVPAVRAAAKQQPIEKPETTLKIDKTNPTSREFPGGRGSDQLIIYTPEFGRRTGTNGYGSEAVVRAGTVVDCEGNNSVIPADGFVVSGHGKASEWIIANLPVGAEVRIVDGTLHARFTLGSKEVEIRKRIERAEVLTTSSKGTATGGGNSEGCRVSCETAREWLAKADRAVATRDAAAAEAALRIADRVSRQALYAAQPSVTPEGRGAWFRLAAKGPDDVKAMVKRTADHGLNMLFPETWYWSHTLCPQLGSDSPTQHPEFGGFDPLKVMIDEAHARGMQVHAWCEVFFIGPGSPQAVAGRGTPALALAHPEWLAVSRCGTTTAPAEEQFMFFCPANPEPRDYLLRQFELLVTKYELDGFQFDYIRYPTSLPYGDGFCYCDYCRETFKAETGTDPMDIDPGRHKAIHEKWCAWRSKRVSTFVEETCRRLHKARPGLIVSAAVFPEPDSEGRNEKFQYWPDWAKNRWVDLLCPMIYRTDTALVGRLTRENVKHAQGVPVLARARALLETVGGATDQPGGGISCRRGSGAGDVLRGGAHSRAVRSLERRALPPASEASGRGSGRSREPLGSSSGRPAGRFSGLAGGSSHLGRALRRFEALMSLGQGLGACPVFAAIGKCRHESCRHGPRIP